MQCFLAFPELLVDISSSSSTAVKSIRETRASERNVLEDVRTGRLGAKQKLAGIPPVVLDEEAFSLSEPCVGVTQRELLWSFFIDGLVLFPDDGESNFLDFSGPGLVGESVVTS